MTGFLKRVYKTTDLQKEEIGGYVNKFPYNHDHCVCVATDISKFYGTQDSRQDNHAGKMALAYPPPPTPACDAINQYYAINIILHFDIYLGSSLAFIVLHNHLHYRTKKKTKKKRRRKGCVGGEGGGAGWGTTESTRR